MKLIVGVREKKTTEAMVNSS